MTPARGPLSSKPMSLLAHRRLCWLAAVLALAAGATAQAQTQNPPASAPAGQATGAGPAAPYLDREIEGLAPLEESTAAPPAYNAEGLPRFLRLETRLGTQPFETERKARLGHAVFALVETPNHGTLSADGSYAPHARRGTLTLRQRGLPWDGGWLANHELGVINTLAPAITRLPSRIFVPSAIVQGASAEWENAGRGLQLQAAGGQPGRLEGLPTSGFRSLAGRRASLGVQWHPGGNDGDAPATTPGLGWTLALRHERASGVSALDDPTLPGDFIDAHSTGLALRHTRSDWRVQGQLVDTRASHVSGARRGFWVDSEWDDGPRTHGAGVFRLEPDLTWAQQPLPSDISGAYLRTAWRTRQWSAEAAIDWLRSISGRARDGTYATASARWRLGRGSSLGTGFSVRRFDGHAWDSYGDWRFDNGWGTSGLRLELSGGESQARVHRLVYDQDWNMPQGFNLATTVGAGRIGLHPGTGEPAQDVWNAALSLSAPVGYNALVRGNLNTEQGSGSSRRWGLNLGANWHIDPHWTLEASLNRSSGKSLTTVSLDPLAPPLPTVVSNSDRSYALVLRYEQQAGSRSIPLGGKLLDGGGRIEGVVYFDANKSGAQEASETGAPGVTVFLDNRYAVRTDAQGRFEFPFVASGPRTVTVRNDTLPLPWAVVDDGSVKVDVRLRETVRLSIPVQRSN